MNFCPACGNALGVASKFCDGCGYKLDSISVPPPPKEAQTGADFDDRFTSCMVGNGYKVPLGALPKLKALLPDVLQEAKERAFGKGLEAGWDITVATFAIEALEMDTPPGWLSLLADFGEEAYDRAPFLHALFDCSIRAAVSVPDFPGARAITDTLDLVPVPPVMLPHPPPEQLPVQLPPPPANWSPAVIPMADPAPAAPKPPSGNMPWPQQVLVTLGVLILIAMVMLIGYGVIKQGGFNGGGGGGTWYMHYSCGGDASCIGDPPPAGNGGAIAPGGNTGIISTESDQASCNNDLIPFQNIGLAQSYWCDQSSDPAEAS